MSIYEQRPFKVRNADEYDLSQILELFVDPLMGSRNPFEYENAIIKGKMGSGKTMYLRANYVFYLYSIIPSLLSKKPLFLPVFLRLSDFQHINKPDEIYKKVIISVIESISQVCIDLQNCEKMASIHQGMKALPKSILSSQRIKIISDELIKMGSKEYVQMIKDSFSGSATIMNKFLELSSKFEKEQELTIKQKPSPGIADIKFTYDYLLKDKGGRLLLLVDEAGALDKSFFRSGTSSETSFFEILMNQLRTTDFVRTKIAVYPNSYSDILAETRYGDVISLEDNVIDNAGYGIFRKKTIVLINNYLSNSAEKTMNADSVFNISMNHEDSGDCLEHIINASEGNLRRLVQLLDLSMIVAHKEHHGRGKVEIAHVLEALKNHASNMESLHSLLDREFLETISKACRRRGSFRFKFPSKSPILSKFLSKSEEQNLLRIIEVGSGRRGTTYAFDYAYCVLRDIPTHFLKNTERIDKDRSRVSGEWSNRVVQISEEIIAQASLPGKIEGDIEWLHEDTGFAKGEDSKQYFISRNNVIADDNKKQFIVGKRIRFSPAIIGDALFALGIEIP